MYETFFGLERRPFLAVPDTDLFFSTASMSETRQTVERIVRRGEGISLVFGESGTGKTLLLRLLRKSLDAEFTVSLLFNGRLETPKAFLQQVLFDLRLPFSNADETELRLALWDFARQEATPGFVLLIDDAQHLSNSVLAEIRLLMNCDDGAVPFFRVVLAGTAELEDNLTNPSLDAFNQRVVSRSYLDTLTREETVNYVSWQTNISRLRGRESGFELGLNELDYSGRHGEIRRLDAPHGFKTESIFTDGAKRLIYQLTDGLPRLINQLCDAALVLAAERISRSVDEALLQTAWAQLQQIKIELPVSKDDSLQTESLDEQIARKRSTLVLKEFDALIEFGALEDPEPFPDVSPPSLCVLDECTPPPPENDWEISDIEELLQAETPIYVHALPILCDLDEEDSLTVPDEMVAGRIGPQNVSDPPFVEEDATGNDVEEISAAVEEQELVAETAVSEEGATIPLTNAQKTTGFVTTCRTIPYPVRRRRIEPDVPRKYRKHQISRNRLCVASLSLTSRSFELCDPWVGCLTTRLLFLPVYLSALPIAAELPTEETVPMDQETLEQYGREVLENHPPFVRKVPQYAYETPTETETESYPHPFYELPLSWSAPQSCDEFGYGIAYSDFLQRELAELETRDESQVAVAESAAAPISDSLIIRLALLPNRPMSMSSTTSLDERFDEWETVEKLFAPIEENSRWKRANRSISIRQIPDDDELTKKIEAVVYRITQAAAKIERAADVSENAGKKIERTAESVEAEVHTVLPSYKELFQQLSDFTEEITVLRMKSEARVFVFPSPILQKQDKCFPTFSVSETNESKPPRLGSPQALFEFPATETERRIDAKTLFQ